MVLVLAGTVVVTAALTALFSHALAVLAVVRAPARESAKVFAESGETC
jgi:hypothetical protein